MVSRTAGWPTDIASPLALVTHLIARIAATPGGWLESVATSGWDRNSTRRPRLSNGTAHASKAADDANPNLRPWADLPERSRFQKIVLPQLNAAYNFARFLSRDADGAQDIVQEAAIRAFRNFDSYRGGDVRAWLFTIVRNCHHDRASTLRRAARFEVALVVRPEPDGDGPPSSDVGNMPSDEDTPEEALIRKTDAERVRAVLVGLHEASREILVLRELEDLSYREIAEVIDVPIGTVMSRLARARREFAEAWSAREPAFGDRR